MVSCARATRGLRRPSDGLMARLGVPVGGRVRKLRAVGDHLARPQGRRLKSGGRSTCAVGNLPGLPVSLVPPVSHVSRKETIPPRKKDAAVATGSAGVPGLTNGVLAFLIHRLPLIMFDDFLGGIFLTRLLLCRGRIAGGHAAGHDEQEHGEDCRRHNGHGTSLILSVLGIAK